MRLWRGVAALLLGAASTGLGQSNVFVYPAGGTVGSELEIEVTSCGYTGMTQAYFSGEGVKATYLGTARRQVRNKKGRLVPVEIPNRLRFKVAIDREAAPGTRDLRVMSAYRALEAVSFEIADGSMPEVGQAPAKRTPVKDYTLTNMPVCLNGRIYGAEGDSYSFQASQGMILVAYTVGDVLPPGSFLPQLSFTDQAGEPCEGVTVHCADSAPVAVFEVPADGTYRLVVTSGADEPMFRSVYRIRFGELPLITKLTPESAREGESLNVRLEGVNLPRKRVRLFTGGKNSALCMQSIVEDAYALPSLGFDLEGEAAAPDFRVTMEQASLNVPSAGSALVNLKVERFNGFNGAVSVGLDLPPLSIASEGGDIPADECTGAMTVSTDGARYPRVPFELSLVAIAEINGQPVKRPVIPVGGKRRGGARMQPGFNVLGARASHGLYSLRIDAAPKAPLVLRSDVPVEVPLLGPTLAINMGVQYQPVVVWPAQGFTVTALPDNGGRGRAAVMLQADGKLLPAGSRGRLILGCVRNDADKTNLLGVTQCHPFVVK